jgi:hypothetical protein
MNNRNVTKDSVLERLVNETAKELGYSQETVWKVYNHFYNFIYTMMTQDSLRHVVKEEKRKRCVNILIPGFGRFNNIFGKIYKTKGAKEEFHIKRANENRNFKKSES